MNNHSSYAIIESVAGNELIQVDNPLASAQISLFGGHVISFTPKHDKKQRLWLSSMAKIDGSTAIRGGVPVCWPWFSNQFPQGFDNLPAHGIARTSLWQLQSVKDNADDGTEIVLFLDCAGVTGFPYRARLTLNIVVAEHLSIALTTTNLDDRAFAITSALHSYFLTESLEKTRIEGLTGSYRDKTREFQHFETPDKYHFQGEVDRIHETPISGIRIVQETTETPIQQQGHDSIVIWNPGHALVKTINNIPNNEVERFVCVEAAITNPLLIQPGNQHTLTQLIF